MAMGGRRVQVLVRGGGKLSTRKKRGKPRNKTKGPPIWKPEPETKRNINPSHGGESMGKKG